MSRVLRLLALVASISGCKNPFADRPPLEEGQAFSFVVAEYQDDTRRNYVLRARMREVEDGLELHMVTPHRTIKVPVDEKLRPIDEKNLPIEFATVLTGTTAQPGLVWLPSEYRGLGVEWNGNETRGVLFKDGHKVIEVLGKDGMPRFYELETGVLVDFRIEVNRVRIRGSLVGAAQ